MCSSQTKSVVVRAPTLFVSPHSPSRAISKNAISFFLREVISGAGAVMGDEGPPLRAHSIRGVSTSTVFLQTGQFLGCRRPQLGSRIQFLLHFL